MSHHDAGVAATDDVERVGAFTIAVETAWDPPASSGLITVVAGFLDAATGGFPLERPVVEDPSWRVVLYDGPTPIATSWWSDEWNVIEELKADWLSRLRSTEPSEVRATAGSWF
jgi:hypothetical protein